MKIKSLRREGGLVPGYEKAIAGGKKSFMADE
jgi:hypothetical protein